MVAHRTEVMVPWAFRACRRMKGSAEHAVPLPQTLPSLSMDFSLVMHFVCRFAAVTDSNLCDCGLLSLLSS